MGSSDKAIIFQNYTLALFRIKSQLLPSPICFLFSFLYMETVFSLILLPVPDFYIFVFPMATDFSVTEQVSCSCFGC